MFENSLDFSWSPERAPGFGSRVLTVLQYLNSVDEDVLHSDRVLVRRLVSRLVRNRLWIKDYHIAKVTFLKKTAMVEAQVCGRQSAQPPDRFLKRNHFLFAHILP